MEKLTRKRWVGHLGKYDLLIESQFGCEMVNHVFQISFVTATD